MGEITRNAIGPALGAEIRAARERAGLGVREAARRLRISHSYLIFLERGERAPSTWTAGRLVAVLALEGPTANLIQGYGRRVEATMRERDRARRSKPPQRQAWRSKREVPIAPGLAKALAAHRLASPWSKDDAFVFAKEGGGPLQARDLYRWFKPASKRAGAEWAAFHALRHTAASRWLQSGVTIAQVARLLGHHDPGFTLRTYISVMLADLPDGRALASAVGLE